MTRTLWPAVVLWVVVGAAARGDDALLPERADVPPPEPPPGHKDDDRAAQYRVWGYLDRPVTSQRTDLGLVRQEFTTPFPVWQDDRDLLAGTVRVRNLHFDTAATLPDSGRPFPRDLWDLRVGLNYVHTFDNGWKAGLLPRFGSPSDKPFHSIRETNLGATAFVRAPAARAGDFWSASLTYFPNYQLPFPVPGLAYEWNPSERLKVSAGVPFAVTWQPTPCWRFDAEYTPLAQVAARAAWEPVAGARFYAAFDWDNEGYFLADRAVTRDLFFFVEKRLSGGGRLDLTERLSVELAGGYAFDRTFGVGRSALNLRSDRVDVAAGPFLAGWLLFYL